MTVTVIRHCLQGKLLP